jgi:hypothetical protein
MTGIAMRVKKWWFLSSIRRLLLTDARKIDEYNRAVDAYNEAVDRENRNIA